LTAFETLGSFPEQAAADESFCSNER